MPASSANQPGRAQRHYRGTSWPAGHRYVDPQPWFLDTNSVAGSWWPAWSAWLAGKNAAPRVAPPAMGNATLAAAPLAAAPGRYVHQR